MAYDSKENVWIDEEYVSPSKKTSYREEICMSTIEKDESISLGSRTDSNLANSNIEQKNISLDNNTFVDREMLSKNVENITRTPFNLNRWLLIILYTFVAFITGPTFFSWASLRSMLYAGDTYIWLCGKGITNPESDVWIDPKTGRCRNQEAAIQLLYSICSSCMFAFSALGGVINDLYGPKISAIFGMGSQMLAWFLLGASTQSFQAYIPSMILLGLGIDAAFFGCITGSYLFPKRETLVIAILGGARSASFYVTYIMEKIIRDDGSIFAATVCTYSGVFIGTCILIAVFLIPWKPFQQIGMENNNIEKEFATDIHSENTNQINHGPINAQKIQSTNINHNQNYQNYENNQNQLKSNKLLNLVTELNRLCCNMYFLPIALLLMLTLQRIVFFGSASEKLLTPGPMEFFKVVAPLSFIPCPILGWFANRFGIMPAMIICNTAGTFMIVFLMIPQIVAAEACQYIAVVLYVIYVSFLLSQAYCYVADTFEQKHMGKLVGVMCLAAGLFMLTAVPMYSFSLENGFYPMMIYTLISSGLMYVLLGFVWILKRTKGERFTDTPKTKNPVCELQCLNFGSRG